MSRQLIELAEFRGVWDVRGDAPYATILESAMRVLESAGNVADSDTIGVASKTAAECLRRMGRFDESLLYYTNALKYLMVRKDRRNLAWACWGAANVSKVVCEFRLANDLLQFARQFGKEEADIKCVLYADAGLAELMRIQGFYKISFGMHAQCLRDFESLRDLRGTTWALEGMAQIYRHCGYARLAFEYFTKAFEIASISGDERGLAFAMKCLGEIEARSGRFDKATARMRNARDLFCHLRYEAGIAYTDLAFGDVWLRKGLPDVAAYWFGLAHDRFQRAGDKRGMAFADLAIAFAMISTQERKLAMEKLVTAAQTFCGRIAIGMKSCIKGFKHVGYTDRAIRELILEIERKNLGVSPKVNELKVLCNQLRMFCI